MPKADRRNPGNSSGRGIGKASRAVGKSVSSKESSFEAALDAAKSASPLEADVYEGLAGVRLAMRRFLAFSESAVTAAGITSQQYQALLVLKVSPPEGLMIRELAQQMMLQPHGAVQLADRLTNAGLAKRFQSSEDRRSVLVTLTPVGERMLESLAADHLREMLTHEPLLAESLTRLRRMSKLR